MLIKNKILHSGPCFLSIFVFYVWIEAIIDSFQSFSEEKIFIALFVAVSYSVFCFPLLISEYYFIFKKSTLCGLILSILCSLFALIRCLVFCAGVLGYFNIILASPDFKTGGDFLKELLYIIFLSYCSITHFLMKYVPNP